MREYTPFLKMKANEVAALQALPADISQRIIPFLDLPHNKDRVLSGLEKMISDSSRKMKKMEEQFPEFFLDMYDIPDSLASQASQGTGAFNSVAVAFKGQNFIPVVGLDRSPAYVSSVLLAQSSGLLTSKKLAIRLVEDDYQSFAACKGDLTSLTADAKASGFVEFILVLDMRVCISMSPSDLASALLKFIGAAGQTSLFNRIIITGSSIPAQIVEIVATEKTVIADRVELQAFRLMNLLPKATVGFGDYTVVSPDYSETDFPKELLRNITAPKICYPFDDSTYISRGGALKTHRRGSKQYNDMADILVKKPFFRGVKYSFGEDFLLEKAKGHGTSVTPSSILKPTICAHMTYMVRDHPLFI